MEAVPYVGAAAERAAGIDSTGVTVAVLDSGICYGEAVQPACGSSMRGTAASSVRV